MNEKYFALISSDAPRDCISAIMNEFEVVLLPLDEEIAAPVRSHPDMITTVLDNKIFFPVNYAVKHRALVGKIAGLGGLEPVVSTFPRSPVYPADVSLNCAVVGNLLLCRKKSASVELLSAAGEAGMEIVDVRQGYAGCSTLVLGGSASASDVGIYSALSSRGVDCYLYPNDKIKLEGYSCGFVGGCGGVCENVVYLFGTPDAGLLDFVKSKGYDVKLLSNAPLFDCGGIKFIRKGL